MTRALVIGGTGFVGRHTVASLLADGYDVSTLSRRDRGLGTVNGQSVDHVSGDRREDAVVEDVAARVDPEVVVDCAAFYPGDVDAATAVFHDIDAYVYVSSGAVYARQEIPKREDETPLHDCTDEQASDDTLASYGPRKAECDREARRAAERGCNAMVLRPTLVYGPLQVASAHEESEWEPSWVDADLSVDTRHDYWIHRIANHDRVIVPGDGTAIWHRVYVADVGEAVRVLLTRGDPGEAYNAADRRVCTLGDVLELIAAALDTSVETVHAGRRELAAVDLDPNDFDLYHHAMTEYPHVLETCKLSSLGWSSTSADVAMKRTVEESMARDRDTSPTDPDRTAEERLIERLAG